MALKTPQELNGLLYKAKKRFAHDIVFGGHVFIAKKRAKKVCIRNTIANITIVPHDDLAAQDPNYYPATVAAAKVALENLLQR